MSHADESKGIPGWKGLRPDAARRGTVPSHIQSIVDIIDAAAPLEPPGAVFPQYAERLRGASKRSSRKPAQKPQHAQSNGEGGSMAPGAEKRADEAPMATVPASTGNSSGPAPRDEDHPIDGEEPPDGPRSLGYSAEGLNREYALVKVGSQAVIFQENPSARLIEHQVRMLGIDAFKTWYRNKFTEVRGRDGKIKRITWASAWLDARDRRQYQGIEFFPDSKNAPGSPQYLNLWSGFAVTPAANSDWRKYKTFRDHLLNNICSTDEQHFNYLFAWIAHIVQRPRERIGIALVLRGKMGTGKTKVGEIIGSLFPRHYFLVDDPRYVTGQFNAHMASCLLLQADEAVWAGDKAAEGRLKGLITAPMQQIEAKGIDPIRLDNFVRLIMTSNEEWVVPAGKDERRFAVLDVDPRCAKNHDYFAEMDREMADGGLAHLLADLLAFDLTTVDLRNAPHTGALLEQKFRSLSSVDAWWLERLMSGSTSRHGVQWQQEVPCQVLFDDYAAVSEKIGIRRKREQIAFGMALSKLVSALPRAKRLATVDDEHGKTVKRTWCYLVPPLAAAREDFERVVEQTIEWPVDDGEDIPPDLDDVVK